MIPLEVEQWLSSIKMAREFVQKRVEESVRRYCNDKGYAYRGRAKQDQSVAEKLETGRVPSLAEFDDLFGCAIITPNLSVEGEVVAYLDKVFHRVALRQRHETRKDPDVFRFEATRFIGKLRIPEGVDLEDSRIPDCQFEVQIPTAFEHAWSVATHQSAYKTDKVDWKLERLAAQMKALVEQLDGLAVAYSQSSESIVAHPCDRIAAETRVLEAFSGFMAAGMIPEECGPSRWGLFAKNVVGLIEAADWGRRIDLTERIETAIGAVDGELKSIGVAKFPISLSLYQFTLGVLIQTGTVRQRFRKDRYFPPVSKALESIFPKASTIQNRCNLETPIITAAQPVIE